MENTVQIEYIIEGKTEISLDMVSSIYVGTPHSCMCGCSGRYYYTSKNKDWSSKNRGYEVTEDDIDDKKVKILFYALTENNKPFENIDNYIFTKCLNGKQFTIYLVK